jgi:hypothetical protein
MWTITEPGLYELVIRSDKPAARPFMRWLTHEVIPSIRKTGAYALPGRQLTSAQKSRWGWQPIKEVVRKQGYGSRTFTAAANELELEGVDHFNEGNYVVYSYGNSLPTEGVITRAEKLLGVPREQLFTAEVLAAYPFRGPGRRNR